MKKLIFEGAEAKTFLTEFFGGKAIEKNRTPKKYRTKKLDDKIRKNRTRDEVNLLHKAKLAGIRTPVLFEVNKEKGIILMEFIKEKKMKEKINKMNKKDFELLGKEISLLHENQIVHGDLTTNNILFGEKKFYFIDFGLGFNSNKAEDFAVDLLGFKRTFLSGYPEKKKEWNWIEKGYQKSVKFKEVINRIKAVEKRGRYL
ncbi:MAG: Kae1-associated kinase Bud32 [Candidatus Diapherotrites archaeon CG10_big_fil_rev_8_21_14_0_10_31_34]|nr:MAG: Kae1-associated kinase Bud32 [Candidatus Diapherotrites archaeon CG10_big_fil_rev_8_21_14_0_10_31_34]